RERRAGERRAPSARTGSPMADEACRVDVWLWRARFCKTRTLASRLVDSGQIRIIRAGLVSRLDKPSRTLRPGDELVFAFGGRLIAIRVEALGARRGPPEEARGLYAPLDSDDDGGRVRDRSTPPLTTRAPG
ncbi:MAG: RNA-binding protein, partial [Caulobacteraceae bacterium]|nr:RNA-binding protein [Caulobacteraceae bacterium]